MATYDYTKVGDSAGATTDRVYPLGGRRNDAGARTHADADGDYGQVSIDSSGRVGVADLGGSITVDAPAATPVFVRPSDGTSAQNFAFPDMDSGAGTQNRIAVGLIVPASGGAATVPGDATNGLDVDVTRVPTDPFGANADASSPTGSYSAKLRAIAEALQIIDDWDETDRAKVNPIVGQAGVAAGAGAVGATTQRTTLASDDPAVVALQIIDDWDETDRAKVNIIAGQAGITAGAGAVAANTPRVTHASDDPVTTAVQIMDDWDESDRAKVNPVVGQAGVQGGSGVVSANTQRVTLATDVALPAGTNNIGDVDVLSYPLQTNRTASGALGAAEAAVTISAEGLASITWEIPTGLVGTVSFEATLDDSTWFAVNAMVVSGSPTGSLILSSTGTFDRRGVVLVTGWSQFRLRVSAYTSGSSTARLEGSDSTGAVSVWGVFPGNGANALGKNESGTHSNADIGVLALGIAQDVASPTARTSAGQYTGPATDTEGSLWVIGNRRHDDADSGAPIKVGGRAVNAEITAIANGDRSDLITDLVGKLVTNPYSVPEDSLSGTGNSTGTSDTAVIAAQSSGIRIYVTTLIIANTSSTDTYVNIKDGTTTKLVVPAPKNSGAIIQLPKPLRGTAATALNFASGTGVTTMYVSAVGYKGV